MERIEAHIAARIEMIEGIKRYILTLVRDEIDAVAANDIIDDLDHGSCLWLERDEEERADLIEILSQPIEVIVN